MSVSDDKRAEILFEHYETTVKDLGQNVKYRYRYLFFSLLVVFVRLVQFVAPENTELAIREFLSEYLKLSARIEYRIVELTLLFALTLLIVRYFQLVVFVGRQQKYANWLEDKLCEELRKELVIFEGKYYRRNYRTISSIHELLYKHAIPLIFLLTAAASLLPDGKILLFVKFDPISLFSVTVSLTMIVFVLSYWCFLSKRCSNLEKRIRNRGNRSGLQQD